MWSQILQFQNVFRVPDLRKRVLITLGFLAIYRVGAVIPVPGIDPLKLEEFFRQMQGTLFGIIDLFTGGAFQRMTIFALGVMPYITASIVLQLLTVIVPRLEALSKEGELGRRKITEYTRYLTVLLSMIQSFGIAITVEGFNLVQTPGLGFRTLTVITLTAGTIFLMWLGEQITEKGIGNGISLLIFAGIIVDLPRAILGTIGNIRTGQMAAHVIIILLALMLSVVAFVIWFEQAQRRIPVQYPKRVAGRRVYNSVSTHLPLKVNPGGVMPIIFAISIVTFPQTLSLFAPGSKFLQSLNNALSFGEPLYTFLYAIGILFFQYFYTAIVFNPENVAEDIKKYGAFIPGIRPGKHTADHIDSVLSKLTFVGALYLIIIAIIPEILMKGLKLHHLPGTLGVFFDTILPDFVKNGLGVPFYFGGTSLLIAIGVALDTLQQIEAQLTMRHYEGLLRKGKVRGRRYF